MNCSSTRAVKSPAPNSTPSIQRLKCAIRCTSRAAEPSDEISFSALWGRWRRRALWLVLHDPTIGDESISYAIDVFEGEVPAEAGPCTLFIDPLGRLLSSVSVAGMHRRDRRRRRGRF
jgi:hypothetical protein